MNETVGAGESPVSEIARIGKVALKAAYLRYKQLGIAGTESVQKNQFGDIALRGDVEAEEAVLEVLIKEGLPITVVSEEHGVVTIGKAPELFAVLDGIDGSSNYLKDPENGRFGTILGIFTSTDPRYNDYIFSGAMEHARQDLYIGVQNQGAWVENLHGLRQLKTNEETIIRREDSQVYVDTAFDPIFKTHVFDDVIRNLGSIAIPPTMASCVHYLDLAAGKVLGVVECTRKKNLEIAGVYGLVKEAGGVMIDINGESLDDKKYKDYHQNDHHLIFTACTPQYGLELIRKARD